MHLERRKTLMTMIFLKKYISFVFNYKIISTNSHILRKIINLINHIKFLNYLYYHFKFIIFLSLYLLNYFSLMFEEKIIK